MTALGFFLGGTVIGGIVVLVAVLAGHDCHDGVCPKCFGAGAMVNTVGGRHVTHLCPVCPLGRTLIDQNEARFGADIAGNVMPLRRPHGDAS